MGDTDQTVAAPVAQATMATSPLSMSSTEAIAPAAGTAPEVLVGPATPVSLVDVVPSAASTLLAWVGLGPLSTSTGSPVSPAPSPALVLASAFVRRELDQAVVQQAPAISLAAVQTSQTTGLLGGVLHLLFNQTPTIGYNPAENTQTAGGVVLGDLNLADADGDALITTVTQGPQHGTVVVNPDGSFTYTPDQAFAQTGGVDTFDVTVSDDTYFHLAHLGGGHIATATVAVTVEPINTVIATIDVGDGPFGVAVSPDGAILYVTNALGDSVSVVDTGINAVAVTIPVGGDPDSVAVSPDGTTVYVTNFADSTVSVIDTATNTVATTIPVPGVTTPNGVAVNPDGTTAYVGNQAGDTVWVIDTATNFITTTIPIGDTPRGVAVSPDGTRVYVSNGDGVVGAVSVIDTATNTVTNNIPVGAGAVGLALSPDGTRVYVANFTDNTVSVIDTDTNSVTATIPVGSLPFAVAVSPDGTRVLVTNDDDDTVSVIDTATNTVTATISVGDFPQGVAISPDGTTAYVTNTGDDTVSVIRL